MAMSEIEGASLLHLPRECAIRELPNLAASIARLHRCNLVHGDIKPSNVIQTTEGITLLDWEFSEEHGKPRTIFGGTRNRSSAADDWGVSSKPQDVFGLGVTLAEIVLGIEASSMPGPPHRLSGILDLFGYRCGALIFNAICMNDPEGGRQQIRYRRCSMKTLRISVSSAARKRSWRPQRLGYIERQVTARSELKTLSFRPQGEKLSGTLS